MIKNLIVPMCTLLACGLMQTDGLWDIFDVGYIGSVFLVLAVVLFTKLD